MASKEYEAKFLDIDRDEMRERLKRMGAELIHEKKKYVRAVFHRCKGDFRGYARIRDENGKVTMTVKIYRDPKYPDEYEITIKESFEKGLEFLKALGLEQKAFQETYREKWSHPLVHEITFDDVPGLPTYMEIDATTESDLNEMIEKLELDTSKMRFGAFDATFEEYYGIPIDEINDHTPSLTFSNILKEIKPRKNKELLEKIAKSYQETNERTKSNHNGKLSKKVSHSDRRTNNRKPPKKIVIHKQDQQGGSHYDKYIKYKEKYLCLKQRLGN